MKYIVMARGAEYDDQTYSFHEDGGTPEKIFDNIQDAVTSCKVLIRNWLRNNNLMDYYSDYGLDWNKFEALTSIDTNDIYEIDLSKYGDEMLDSIASLIRHDLPYYVHTLKD